MKDKTRIHTYKEREEKKKKDKTKYTRRIKQEKKKKDKTQYPLTNREKRIIRRIKHNTHVQREGREKEEGGNTIHAYK